MVELMSVRASREGKPPHRRPRKGVAQVIVQISGEDPQSSESLREAVGPHENSRNNHRRGNAHEEIDWMEMLRREDIVLLVFVMYLVESVEPFVMHQSVQEV